MRGDLLESEMAVAGGDLVVGVVAVGVWLRSSVEASLTLTAWAHPSIRIDVNSPSVFSKTSCLAVRVWEAEPMLLR